LALRDADRAFVDFLDEERRDIPWKKYSTGGNPAKAKKGAGGRPDRVVREGLAGKKKPG